MKGTRPETGDSIRTGIVDGECKACLYFHVNALHSGWKFTCRKYAPMLATDSTGDGVWPTIKPEDWCGDFAELKGTHLETKGAETRKE